MVDMLRRLEGEEEGDEWLEERADLLERKRRGPPLCFLPPPAAACSLLLRELIRQQEGIITIIIITTPRPSSKLYRILSSYQIAPKANQSLRR